MTLELPELNIIKVRDVHIECDERSLIIAMYFADDVAKEYYRSLGGNWWDIIAPLQAAHADAQREAYNSARRKLAQQLCSLLEDNELPADL